MKFKSIHIAASAVLILSTNSFGDALSVGNTCGSLVGKAAACGVNTETLSRRCGQKIDELTVGAPQERIKAIKQFMLSAEMSAKYQKAGRGESCSSIRAAVSDSGG